MFIRFVCVGEAEEAITRRMPLPVFSQLLRKCVLGGINTTRATVKPVQDNTTTHIWPMTITQTNNLKQLHTHTHKDKKPQQRTGEDGELHEVERGKCVLGLSLIQ